MNDKRLKVHSEIMYLREDGTNVHSDTCPVECSPDNMTNAKWREFIHNCLDEWLDKSRGTGVFYIGDKSFGDDNE